MVSGRTILLVEDDRNDEILTLDALNRSGVTNPIVVVRDGVEALEWLFSEGIHSHRDARRPCLVLLDLKLPKISGLEVLRRIKIDDRTRAVPVVVLTTASQEEDVQNAYGNGANSYVRKPVAFNQFIEAVRQLGMYWTLVNELPG
jgi:CheY-like chemotaxis protein